MMEFVVNNLDLIFVPAGVILFLLVWVTVAIRGIWKAKKNLATGELQCDAFSESMFDTSSPSSSSNWALERSIANANSISDPSYRSRFDYL